MNAILCNVKLVGLSSRIYKEKTYYNCIIILNDYPCQFNCSDEFYNKYIGQFNKDQFIYFEKVPCTIRVYKGETKLSF